MTLINKIKKYLVQIGTSEFDLFGLIQIIKNLIVVNNYPDVSITVYSDTFRQTRIRGELITCTGEMIVAETCVNTDLYNHSEDIKECIKRDILRNIGDKFLTRAYEARKNKEVTESATRYLFSCKEIHNANIQLEVS